MNESSAKWIAYGLFSIAESMALSTASTLLDSGSSRYQIKYEERGGGLSPAYLFNTRTGEVHRKSRDYWNECQKILE